MISIKVDSCEWSIHEDGIVTITDRAGQIVSTNITSLLYIIQETQAELGFLPIKVNMKTWKERYSIPSLETL